MPMPSTLRWGSNVRRVVFGVAALLVLAGLAVTFTLITRADRSPHAAAGAPTHSPTPPAATSPPPAASAGLVPPPSTRDPIVFARAAAQALWSYDTRTRSRAASLTAAHRWMTREKRYADAGSVDALLPSPVLWREMAADSQYATAAVAEGHFPASFTEALQEDPGAITTAYVYAVTVTGKQSIGWKDAPHGGAEPRSVTLAVQCRPDRDCALAGVLPNVAP